jgi:hypothetical protein
VAELVDAQDSGSCGRKPVGVRLPSFAFFAEGLGESIGSTLDLFSHDSVSGPRSRSPPAENPATRKSENVRLDQPFLPQKACRSSYEIFNYHNLLESKGFLEFYNYIDSLFSLCQNDSNAAKELF